MTKLNLDELEALANAAAPGPWREACESGDWFVTNEDYSEDIDLSQHTAFIAASREAIPQLIARIRELEKALEEIAEYHSHMYMDDILILTSTNPQTLKDIARQALEASDE